MNITPQQQDFVDCIIIGLEITRELNERTKEIVKNYFVSLDNYDGYWSKRLSEARSNWEQSDDLEWRGDVIFDFWKSDVGVGIKTIVKISNKKNK